MNWMKIFGGALLVAGTAKGAGMLGFPMVTASSGYYYSIAMFIFCWAMMLATAFLMLEVSLWFEGETNIISMAKASLGRGAEIISWIVYLVFLYTLLALYISGGVSIFNQLISNLLGQAIPANLGLFIYVGLCACVIFYGAYAVDLVNRWLVFAVIIFYLALVFSMVPKVNLSLLSLGQPKYLIAALPVLVTTFGFHLLIPSLKSYFNGNVKELRLAILFGSILALIIYIFWEFVILGVVPITGEHSWHAISQAKDAVPALVNTVQAIVQHDNITQIVRFFTFFALISSFVAVSFGLFDFLADGTKIKKTISGKLVLCALTYIPSTLVIIFYPGKFTVILGFAGIFAAFLLIILPSLMAWSGRYKRQYLSVGAYQMIGGKLVPIVCFIFGLVVIGIEVLKHFDCMPI